LGQTLGDKKTHLVTLIGGNSTKERKKYACKQILFRKHFFPSPFVGSSENLVRNKRCAKNWNKNKAGPRAKL
jgi:hypothetical protein